MCSLAVLLATGVTGAVAAAGVAGCGDDGGSESGGAASDAAPGADAGAPSPAGTAWSPRAPLPSAKQELAVLAVAGNVYVLGGLDAAGRTLADVSVFDPRGNTWSAGAPLPEPLHHVNAAVVGDRVWVVGSLRGPSFTADGRVWVHDPVARSWTPSTAMPPGTERGASMVAAIGGVIYVAGGLRGGAAVADFAAFDTASATWTALPALPAARDHGMGAALGSFFYAIGGRSDTIGGHTPRVDVFDSAARTWRAGAPMPTSRAGAALAVHDGKLVVAGGEGNAADPEGVFRETEAYDPLTNAWTSLEPMRTPRHGTGAASVDGVMLVPGGGTKQALAATDIVEAFAPK